VAYTTKTVKTGTSVNIMQTVLCDKYIKPKHVAVFVTFSFNTHVISYVDDFSLVALNT